MSSSNSSAHEVIDLSMEEGSQQQQPTQPSIHSIFARQPPVSYTPPTHSTANSGSGGQVSAFDLCPICQCLIDRTRFDQHLTQCLGTDSNTQKATNKSTAAAAHLATSSLSIGLPSSAATSASTTVPNVALSSPATLASQIEQFKSFLATQSPVELSQLAPQLQSLEQQIHSVLIPIATMNGLVNIAVTDPPTRTTPTSHTGASSSIRHSNSFSSTHDLEVMEDDGEVVEEVKSDRESRLNQAPSSSSSNVRHVLTSRASLQPGSSSNVRHSDVNVALATNGSYMPVVIPVAMPIDSYIPNTTPASASSSSSTSSSEMHDIPSHSTSISSYPNLSTSYQPEGSMMMDQEPDVTSDEELVRRMQYEEEQAAATARRMRQEAAEREFQEFLQREGTCASCGSKASDQLIQICEDPGTKRAKGQLACEHKVCQTCLRDYLQNIVRRMTQPMSPTSPVASSSIKSKPISSLTEADLVCPTPGCTTPLSQWQLKRVLPPNEFNLLLNCTVRNLMKGGAHYVSCPNPKCGNSFEAVPGTGGANQQSALSTEVGLDGQPMSAAAKLHRSQHRFRCNECSTIFCGSCSSTPYHDGFDCDQWTHYQTAKKCRFCQTSLTASNTARPPNEQFGQRAAALVGGVMGSIAGIFGASAAFAASSSSASLAAAANTAAPPALLDVCTNDECIEKRNQSCDRTLVCGHFCGGIRGERNCLVCLKEDCPAHIASDCEMTEEDFCNICYVEGLGQAPTLQLDCGHLFHAKCITDKITRRWPGARITFGFLNCPLCKKEISHPSLKALMAPLIKLKQEVGTKATQRLQFEGLDHDDAFMSPQGRYYNRKDDYAMDKFAYYMCSKCKQPYFGGQRRCEEAAQQQAGEEKFEADHLVCGGCIAGSDAKNCARHGKDYIEFKCKFCCNIATWYCWGTTHFCQDCHRRQENGDYVTRKPVADLPKCAGPGKCGVGVKHPPNGNEFTLGCGLCRQRDF